MTSRIKRAAARLERCPICGRRSPKGTFFCQHCRYPLAVKNLARFSAKEIKLALGFLHKVCSESKPRPFHSDRLSELYDTFWQVYWLRPEKAIFRFIEAALLRSLIERKLFREPFLDVGCGDGLFTALLWGARAKRTADAFSDLDFAQADPFNAPATEEPLLDSVPRCAAFGLDIKPSAVSRASSLGFYEEVQIGDVRKLPYPDGKFQTVFSNMMDDVLTEDLPTALSEISRILRPGGIFVFTTPSPRFRKHLFFFQEAREARRRGDRARAKVLETLDRGRSFWEPRSTSFWRFFLRQEGLSIHRVQGYAGGATLRLWDTGFRPVFPTLISIKESLARDGLLIPVKKLWIEILKNYFARFVRLTPDSRGAFQMIVARREKRVSC